MKFNIKNFLIVMLGVVGFAGVVYAAPTQTFLRNTLPEANNTYDLGSTSPNLRWKNIYTTNLNVSGTCTGCGGGGSLSGGSPNSLTYWIDGTTVSATSSPTVGYLVATTTTATSTFAGSVQVNGGTLFVDANNNRVGIGTTTPGTRTPGTASPAYSAGKTLDINSGTTDPLLSLLDTQGTTGIQIWSDTSGGHGYFDSLFDDAAIRSFNFRTRTMGTPVAAMTILGSGNVGIGTTTPDIYSLGLTKHLTLSTNGASVSSASMLVAGGTTGRARLDLGNESILRAGVWGIDGSHLTFNTNASNSGTTLTEAMRITSSGLVGIGTTSPSAKLSVNDGRVLSSGSSYTNSGFVIEDRAAGGGDWRMLHFSGGSFSLNYSGDGSSYSKFLVDTSGDVGIGTTTPWGKLSVTNTGTGPSFVVEDSTSPDTTPFVIDASGNVGIGTTSPASLLSVSGDTYITGRLGLGVSSPASIMHLDNFGGATKNYIRFSESGTIRGLFGVSTGGNDLVAGDADNDFVLRSDSNLLFAANGGEKMRITSGGSVGIGTTTPTQLLSLQGISHVAALINSTNTGGSVSTQYTNSGDGNFSWSVGRHHSGYFAIAQSGLASFDNEKLVIDTSGNVGIGTTTPGQKLSVAGDILGNNLIASYFTATSTTATSTFKGNVDISQGTVKQHVYPSFNYASTTFTGTTTMQLGPAFTQETWNSIMCFTDTGTVTVALNDGTNTMNNLQASTTVGTVTLSTNNTFVVAEKRFVNIGSPLSGVTKVSCTADKTINP